LAKTGSDLVLNRVVAAEIERRIAEYSKAAGVRAIDILERLNKQAFTNLADAFDGNRLKNPSEWSPALRAAVKDYDPGGPRSSQKITMHDQPAILFKLWDRL